LPARRTTETKKASAPSPTGAYSIAEFCRAHGGMSQAMYFKMRALGQGPVEMELGRRKAISIESAAKWRAQREAAARKSSKAKNQEIAEIAS
jgi:hypothetical protein